MARTGTCVPTFGLTRVQAVEFSHGLLRRLLRSPAGSCLNGARLAIALACLAAPGLPASAAEYAATPLPPGSAEFAGRVARDYWHLFGSGSRSELEALNRELREASQQIDTAKEPGVRTFGLNRGRAAAERLREAVTRHPRAIRVDLTAAVPALAVDGAVELPGDTGALLFEIDAGGEGRQFTTAVRDLTELPRGNNASLVIVDAGATGMTHAVAGLEHLPVGRTTLLVEFRRPGKGNVRLPLDVITPRPGRLKLTILSDDTGQPVPAMVRLTWRTDGRARPPANAIDFAPQFDRNGKVTGERVAYLPGARKGSFWCAPEPFDMALSPGTWEIAVGRGYEHTPVFAEVNIRPGETLEKTIRPKRWVTMRQRGWWSGDDHVHGRLVSDADARNLIAWARAEDVHVTNLLEMGDIFRTYFQQRGFGPANRVQEGEYVLAPAQECPRTREIGHVLTMNISGLVRDTKRYFLYDTTFDGVHRQGGLTGYAHASTGMFEVHRDMTLNVPRQKVDFFEIHQFNNLGTDLYYEFLNLGCKVTASAGSDLPWGGTIGEVRVYSYLGDEPFSADAWFNAFGRGRTFTTSGPMIEFSVDAALPGDEVRVEPGRRLRVRARAWSDPNFPGPMRLEIVRQGDVIRASDSQDPRHPEAELDFTVDAADGFWIAARARTSGRTSAHTTPVYVVRDGLRFWKHEAMDDLIARRLESLRQISELVAQVRRDDQGMRLVADLNQKQLAADGPQLLERVEAAREMYAELKRTALAETPRRGAAAAASRAKSDPPGWELVVEQNFPVADEFPRWRREGVADVTTPMDRTLQIETKRGYVGGTEASASTLWFEQPTTGDARFEFDASADAGSRCSFFFNARPRNGRSVFDWPRPLARPEDYAGEQWNGLCAIDILRADNTAIALRRLGGEKGGAVPQQAPGAFARVDPERVYHFDVRVVGPRVTVLVDGRVWLDVADAVRTVAGPAGGYFGFHNAQPGGFWFDNFRVYRAVPPR